MYIKELNKVKTAGTVVYCADDTVDDKSTCMKDTIIEHSYYNVTVFGDNLPGYGKGKEEAVHPIGKMRRLAVVEAAALVTLTNSDDINPAITIKEE